MKKVSFIWYYDDMTKLEDLNNEEFGMLFRAVADYEINGIKSTNLPDHLRIPYKFLCVQLDLDKKKWELECERRRLAALKGAESRWKSDKNAKRSNRKQSEQPQLGANACDTMRLLPDTETETVTEQDAETEHGTNINAGANLSQNQLKFKNAFPHLEANGELLPDQDIDLLIQKIKESTWLQKRKNLDLNWYSKPKNYNKVINDYYADSNLKDNSSNSRLNELFDNVEELVV